MGQVVPDKGHVQEHSCQLMEIIRSVDALMVASPLK